MEDDVLDAQAREQEVPKKQFMTFRCCNEIYGISLKNVNEIIGLTQYTSIPETEDYIKGLINLRGKVIPVIDVRIRFGKEPLEYNDRTSVIVIQVRETIIGLIVDGIEGVADIREDEILPPPSVNNMKIQSQKYVYGIGKVNSEVRLLLDPDKLIHDTEEEEFDEQEEE
ncbi:MAG: purine-binding chemotaxis protein CheW [Lachnospiraceae bacterium]|jgi:purine-binding chemotaxis protein CheW|nr:purine-binding chemotaxis protein CheW [Lachnospiraceae bacterium]